MIGDTKPPVISFIIPVYNAERYLHQCIGSVLHQLNNCELILVDDGSTDSSGQICDAYASRHQKIKVFHTENRGPSQARNFGVNNAQGEYIVFMDSDDYISCDFAQRFVCAKLSADVIFYPIEKLLMNGHRIPMGDGICVENTHGLKPSEVLSHISNCPKFPASPCGKIVRLDFLKKYQIHFAFNRISEDYDWTYQLLQYSQSFDFFSEGLYTYRQIPQSRSGRGGSKSVEDQLAILTAWEKKTVSKEFRQHLNAFLAYEYAMLLPSYGSLTRKEKKQYHNEVRRCAYLLCYGKSRKLKCIQSLESLIGVDVTSKILYEYIRQRKRRYASNE